ncbi:PREDICTED: cytochrome P450 85A1-like [Populus euphratica]|uniref:Cytochrome P450 85A1-like n=1 Tax=Populus euphratica TaxID=75702 RepID=A0AAJ6XEA9_POPEU|nr:PREDICTED: cytochrome P450 85A1-like [Populus euphratica]
MAVLLVLASWFFVGLSVCFYFALKWNEIWYARKGLPPGTMGWPLFGETAEFLKHGPDFMKKQRARYGNLFRTHVLAFPTVICTDPELNRYILLNETRGLVPGYPRSSQDILGKYNVGVVTGSAHKYLRGSLLSLVNPTMIKDHLLLNIDEPVRSFLANWEGKTIDLQDRTVEFAFVIAFKLIVDSQSSVIYDNFKSEFDKLAAGTISLAINIPGTAYHSGLQGRTRVVKMLRQFIKERRGSSVVHSDILGQIMSCENQKYHLSDDEMIDQIITMLYSGYETVSTTIMMALKYVHDNPKALQELREEHLAIRARRKPEDPIDWDDYKGMRFTRAVIFETSRLAAVVNGLLRKTNQDIELNGFLVPKGWRLYVSLREINFDPILYPEPSTFNPWRWMDNGLENHNYCFIFGGGTRLCPGKELGMVKIATFLHYFVTQYRWEESEGIEIVKFPRVEARNGLPIRVSKY